MPERFPPASEQDWIAAANRETQRITDVSFPYSFTLGDLKLSAINTASPVKNADIVEPINNLDEPSPRISLILSNHAPSLSSEKILQLGVEDIFLPFSRLEKINLLQELGETNSLRSVAIEYGQKDWDSLTQLVENLRQQTKLYLTLYNSSPTEPCGALNDKQLAELVSQINKSDVITSVRWLGIRGDALGNWGATATQELAISLSLMVDYWDRLSCQGVSIESLISSTELALSLSGEFYLDVAKFAAIRSLLYNILKAYGLDYPNPYQIKVRAISGILNKTLYDPDANLMRNTVEALAATVAGADIISLRPHDFRYAQPTAFGQRMAVNVQHLLRHEGNLHRPDNPVNGSYFLESATSQLAEEAWKLFQKIEDGGGYRNSELVNVADQFSSNIEARERQLLKQERVVVGVTRYANPVEQITIDQVESTDEAHSNTGLWETIRVKVDSLTVENQPKVAFLKPESTNFQISERATFVTRLITTLGLQVPLPQGSVEAILSEGKPGLLIFCADDAWYQLHLASLAGQPELASIVTVAVGQLPLLFELQLQGIIDEVLNAKADLTPFLGIVKKMLP
ncbi:MAG: methylmalonyl-CoA mutase family protein [Bacteroidota bacterium]